MNTFSFDWPQSASELVYQSKTGVDLAKLIMGGVTNIDSWLISNRIVPALDAQGLGTLSFCLDVRHHEQRCASCVPMPDGSAFICSVLGLWEALEKAEAIHEIQYIGSRYAPGKHWLCGFQAALSLPGGTPRPLTPAEVASFWTEVTGSRLNGFDPGIFDRLEAIGHNVADRVFTTQGRLGL